MNKLIVSAFVTMSLSACGGGGSEDNIQASDDSSANCKHSIERIDNNGDNLFDYTHYYKYDDTGNITEKNIDIGSNGVIEQKFEYSYSGADLLQKAEYRIYGDGKYEMTYGEASYIEYINDRKVKTTNSDRNKIVEVRYNNNLTYDKYINPIGSYPFDSFEHLTRFISTSPRNLDQQVEYSGNHSNILSIQYYNDPELKIKIDEGGDGTIDEAMSWSEAEELIEIQVISTTKQETWINVNKKETTYKTTYDDGSINNKVNVFSYYPDGTLEYRSTDYNGDGIFDEMKKYEEYKCI